jgi:hypothetical protein
MPLAVSTVGFGGEHCAVWLCVGCWTEWVCREGNIVLYGGVFGFGLNGYVGRGTLCCMAVCVTVQHIECTDSVQCAAELY